MQVHEQPQYSGPPESVNTKCCMSATSSDMPIFVQVFLKKNETRSRNELKALREFEKCGHTKCAYHGKSPHRHFCSRTLADQAADARGGEVLTSDTIGPRGLVRQT